jgi:type IV pilus assembly protein PilN
MIHINLLPFRAARKKENVRRQISLFLLTFVFSAIALFYYNGSLNSQIVDLQDNIRATELELAKYTKIIAEINRIRKNLNILETKIKVINDLQKNRNWPVTFLDTINDLVIEKRMWITNLSVNGNRININGIALDNRTVADFMTRLEKSTVYNSVSLQTVSAKKVQKYNLKSFQIVCNRKVDKKPAKQSAKSKAKK